LRKRRYLNERNKQVCDWENSSSQILFCYIWVIFNLFNVNPDYTILVMYNAPSPITVVP